MFKNYFRKALPKDFKEHLLFVPHILIYYLKDKIQADFRKYFIFRVVRNTKIIIFIRNINILCII